MTELIFKNNLLKSNAVAVRQHKSVLQDRRAVMQAGTLADDRTTQLAQKSNNTGLPDNLKHGIESLSGMSMDNVKVHYNSSKPSRLNAHAYAQGTDIHLAPGQEKHLPHEAWHVVQQAQGRVRPTMQMKRGVPVNDDKGLENEADVMGARALQMKAGSVRGLSSTSGRLERIGGNHGATRPIQRINVGYIPTNAGQYRTVTNLGGYSGDTVRGDKAFNNTQRGYVYGNNIANGGNNRAMPVPQGGIPGNDSTQNGAGLMNREWASLYEPEVDHIVPRADGGANDYRNARIISKNNNTNGQMNRPNRNEQDLKLYTGITVNKWTPQQQNTNQQNTNQQQVQFQLNSYTLNGGSTLNQNHLDDIMTYGIGHTQQNVSMNLGNNTISQLENLQLGNVVHLGSNHHIRIT
jgi:hypothetical protein